MKPDLMKIDKFLCSLGFKSTFAPIYNARLVLPSGNRFIYSYDPFANDYGFKLVSVNHHVTHLTLSGALIFLERINEKSLAESIIFNLDLFE